uniref:Uncharacterized protein n=1 Tax=Timema poppense TaxID=170557 RepID=A0A7R9D737_TIMPO|nr:unnamed protein product [Timema poppensis]
MDVKNSHLQTSLVWKSSTGVSALTHRWSKVECMKPQFYTPVESSVVSKDSPTENDGMRYFRVVCAQDPLPDRQGLHVKCVLNPLNFLEFIQCLAFYPVFVG